MEEGLLLRAYQDTLGIWTIGVGHAATNPIPVRGLLDGEFYQGPPKAGVTITADEAKRLFDLDSDTSERGISALVTAPLTQSQFDACFDFVHQFGLERFKDSTLLLKINRNPFNLGTADNDTGILHEFMRWTRAGGEHQEYVWRRSARRCCIYNGSPIPQALWRKNGFPFAIDKDDKVDYSITPTIYKLIEYGKKAVEPYKFDPSKPIPQAAAPEASTEAKGTAPVSATQPEPEQLPATEQNVGASPPMSPGSVSGPTATPAPPAAAPASPIPAPQSSGGEGKAAEAKPVAPRPAPLPLPPAKNPGKSVTIWGGLITAVAPELDRIGNVLMVKSAAFGPPFLILGIIMIVLGRIGANAPLSASAPIRSQQ